MATDVTFATNIDLASNELRNARAHILSAAPAVAAGKFYYNSADNKLYWYNGTSWISAGGAELANLTGQASAFGQLAANGSASTAARSDHYHELPAHDAAAHSAVPLSALAVPAADVAFNSKKITGLLSGTASGDAVNKGQLDTVSTAASNAQTTANNALPKAGGTMTGDISMSGLARITNLADGVAASDAATLGQVQAAAQGLDVKQSVRVAVASGSAGTYNNAGGTSGNGQFTAAPQVVDGVTLANGERVLVIGSATSTGIYTVITAGTGSNGTWNRAADFDSQADVTPNSFVFVEEGGTYADSGWVLTTNGAITVGGPIGTVLIWTQFTGSGQITAGNGLTKTGNTLDVGAGTGISVAADTVAIDTAVVARKYSTTLSTSATSYTVTHNLGTRDVQVSVVQVGSPYGAVLTAWEATTTNTITVYFATAPTANTLRVNVVG